ncbi:MAG: MutS-related protein, partial [Planctomycetia bacterium]
LGAGTDPTEGAALGRAILDELVHLRCRAMVTTHLGDLKLFALSQKRAENAAMEFDDETLRPTYRLIVGQYGRSCALKIARRLKLPKRLIEQARKYMRRGRVKRSPELAQLQEMRAEAEKARDQAALAEREAKEAAEAYQRKAEQMRHETELAHEIEKARATIRPGDVVRVTKFNKSGTVKRVDSRRKLAAVTVGAVEWELPLDELIPESRSK